MFSFVSLSAIDTCNVVYGALRPARFLLLRPAHVQATLPRSFEPATDVRLRASAALKGYTLDAAAVNSKREGCFLSAPPSCGSGKSMPFDVHMLLAAGVTGRSHDDQRASIAVCPERGLLSLMCVVRVRTAVWWCRCVVLWFFTPIHHHQLPVIVRSYSNTNTPLTLILHQYSINTYPSLILISTTLILTLHRYINTFFPLTTTGGCSGALDAFRFFL